MMNGKPTRQGDEMLQSSTVDHATTCRFHEDETFECSRCGVVCLWCCGCGGQDGEGDDAPPLCISCGQEYYREAEAAERDREEASLAEFRATENAVNAAVEALKGALKDRCIEVTGERVSSLSSSRYFHAGGFKVRVSDHAINPYGSGFWKDDGTELHSPANYELIVPADPGEIEARS